MSGLISGNQKLTGQLSGSGSLSGGMLSGGNGSLSGGKLVERGRDGFSPIIRTFADEKGCDVVITDIRGTKTVRLNHGEKGDPGDSGILATIGGFFTLSVDDNGDLWVYSEEETGLEFEYDSDTGALYVVQEQG